jgi:predicted RNA-binding Zn-ribbon protein involved in translation (DUF1610 family)
VQAFAHGTCPSCGATISRTDPVAATPAGKPAVRITETAVCPACGKWLSRRVGEAWRLTD